MLRRVLIIAGEASGDGHGAGVVRELKRRVPDLDVYGVGGDGMRQAGMDLLAHISGLAFMGFVEVVRHLGVIRRLESTLARALQERRPDVVVLIDYPGFNLRFARRARQLGIPVLYYISPQVWAWHRGRVRRMRHLVSRMKVVFPFEVEIYRQAGVDVEFVGHPLAERIGSNVTRDSFFRQHTLDPGRRLLGIFPGSRHQEIERILPVMLQAAGLVQQTHDVQVALSVAPSLGVEVVRPYLTDARGVVAIEHGTYDLMCHADAGLVTSGTATLEMGWFGTPMAVVYRTSFPTYVLGRMLVRVDTIALCNIVAGSRVVPEYIQHEATPDRLASAVARMLDDEAYAAGMRAQLSVIRRNLGGPGASRRVAEAVLDLGARA